MANRLAILCPGQGGQSRRMFDFARTNTRAEVLLDRWSLNERIGRPVEQAVADEAALFSNRIAQPLIVAATLVAWEAIKDCLPSPVVVAGYSIGEVSSYAVAGALAADDAISLAVSRARLMDACLRASSRQSLMAVSGLNLQTISKLLHQHDAYIAIETGEDNFIVGGFAASVAAVEGAVLRLGGRIGMLPVEMASHTPLMHDAVAPFRDELDRHAFADPQFPVLSGISAEPVYRKDQAISVLSRQIAEPIRWMDCMDACAEAGVTVALELGPGASLSRMLQTRHPQIACRSVADFRTTEGLGAWIRRHFDG